MPPESIKIIQGISEYRSEVKNVLSDRKYKLVYEARIKHDMSTDDFVDMIVLQMVAKYIEDVYGILSHQSHYHPITQMMEVEDVYWDIRKHIFIPMYIRRGEDIELRLVGQDLYMIIPKNLVLDPQMGTRFTRFLNRF